MIFIRHLRNLFHMACNFTAGDALFLESGGNIGNGLSDPLRT